MPPPASELASRLRALDGAPFGAYRKLVGTYVLDAYEIVVDRVAAAPAAGPARLRLRTTTETAGLPQAWAEDPAARLAVEDLVARTAARVVAASGLRREGAPPGSGAVTVEPPGEAIVERGACRVAGGRIELRLLVDLPAQGRTIRGLAAEQLLTGDLVRLATAALLFGPTRRNEAEGHVAAVRRHRALQGALQKRGLVAFFADGSVPALPSSLGVVLEAAGEAVRGKGIPAGVTLIAGGALQGKSVLLEAIASGVHPHPPGHPRAGIATVASAAVVQTERDRSLDRADLSLFLRAAPSGPAPQSVSCGPAPPAFSQAAAAAEAIAAGAVLLLVDEDDSAPSFLGRDARMQRLVPSAEAGLIPLVDRARDLYDDLGVSTIVTSAAFGDFLEAAHTTLVVREGIVEDATALGRQIAAATRNSREGEARAKATRSEPRIVSMGDETSRPAPRIALHGRGGVRVGETIVDLGAIATLVEPGQRRALGAILARVARFASGSTPLVAVLDLIEGELDERGLEALVPDGPSDLARPRRVEIAAALARGATIAPRGGGR